MVSLQTNIPFSDFLQKEFIKFLTKRKLFNKYEELRKPHHGGLPLRDFLSSHSANVWLFHAFSWLNDSDRINWSFVNDDWIKELDKMKGEKK